KNYLFLSPHNIILLNNHGDREFLQSPQMQRDPFFAYSIISKTDRLCALAEAALKIIRMALAVLPCFPITLPKSSFATRNSITDVCSPMISVTSTLSGKSTKA